MSAELTNLLPSERIRAFRQAYFYRLGTALLLAVAVVVVIHAALLAPSYLYLNDTVALERAHLNELAEKLASSGEGEMNARLARLEQDASRILTLSGAPSASAAIRTVLAVPRGGITLTGITFHTPSPDGRLTLTGMAATREDLRRYALALSELPFAKSADLPLSAYAKERDIPFTITLTGPLAI
ncbi:MAG TPA: hypothetical protein PK109_01895 [Candidatus Paceibacterota bacterium]|nr:hypothetical protein [Candidatus Paceibacterota bacterium]